MKSFHPLVLTAAFLLCFTGIATARIVRFWSYQELLDKSDLVVLATPAATNDTQEHIVLPGFTGQHVIGVETKFTVSAVLKGDKALKNFVLHHYRPGPDPVGARVAMVPNGPTFVFFTPAANPAISPYIPPRTYILFLVREPDGRYASVVGQTDPGIGVRVISPPGMER